MTTNRRRPLALSTAALSTLAWTVVAPAVAPVQMRAASAAAVSTGTPPGSGALSQTAAARMQPTMPAVASVPAGSPPADRWRPARLHRYRFPGGGRITAV